MSTLVTDQGIKTHVLEAMAGHLGCDVTELSGNPILCDGEGHHLLMATDNWTLLLDSYAGHLYRTLDDVIQEWFMGDLVSELNTAG